VRSAPLQDLLLDNIVWLLLVVFTIAAGLLNPFFLTVANLQNILVQATVLGFLGLAVALTLLIAEIDLSVVGILALSAAVGAVLMRDHDVSGLLAIAIVIACGGLVGLVNGFCVAKLKMNSLIETLAMGLVLSGGVLALTRGTTINIESSAYNYIGNQRIGTWPVMPIALIVIYLVAAVVLNRTAWGRRLYATGGNPRAAFAAGVDVDRTRLQTFVASGLLAGAAGWLATSYLSGVNSTVGSNLLLYAIAAPVIGGVSLFGGRGRVIGMLGGVLLLTVVQVGLQIVNISAYYVQMVGGGMIFLAVFVDAVRVRSRGA
jgi:simple sugar transport system permease protein/ribose transport system permease protein